MTSPLSVSQILTVLSEAPDTTFLPSADNATEKTRRLWPDKSNIKQYSIWGGRNDIHYIYISYVILCMCNQILLFTRQIRFLHSHRGLKYIYISYVKLYVYIYSNLVWLYSRIIIHTYISELSETAFCNTL